MRRFRTARTAKPWRKAGCWVRLSAASTVLCPVVDRHQHQVDIGLLPDGVVRQAAAEDGGEDRAVLLHPLDQDIERRGEGLLDGPVLHTGLQVGRGESINFADLVPRAVAIDHTVRLTPVPTGALSGCTEGAGIGDQGLGIGNTQALHCKAKVAIASRIIRP